ncbi:MAG TPA: hypothetical protein VJ461_03335 [Candidatus Nanoarchaeia archaeon]|nr:hypothetical protein [Candidatus Nanoarchaeia archaeon]
MGIFKKEYTLKGWQIGFFKWACISFGILVGVYFAEFWESIFWLVWVVFIVTLVFSLAFMFDLMKKKK